MSKSNCNIITSSLNTSTRKTKQDPIVSKNSDGVNITYIITDTIDDFEVSLTKVCKNSTSLYNFTKRVFSFIFSIVSVLVIMFAIISASIYEDISKKILFEMPFEWSVNDTISLFFVGLFFIGLVMMPSILDGESSQFKEFLLSWFNKDARRLKRVSIILSSLDSKTKINIYNADLLDTQHWLWKIVISSILKRFVIVNFYVRNDQIKQVSKKLKNLECLNIHINKLKNSFEDDKVSLLLSSKEQKLFKLLQLSSSLMIKQDLNKFISLELFEYCGRNFLEDTKSNTNQLISGFQNFINRSFDDFHFLKQEKSFQIYLTNNVKVNNLEDEHKRLSYHLRNHIEECVNSFTNPISLIILYYYIKDVVLDERRYLIILEKFIDAVYEKQHYELIDLYWFDIANMMFDSSNIDDFDTTNNSIYRKISIDSLNKLIFLFERNGHFNQAILIVKYLYEINPNKYSVNLCSLYERMGQFDKAYDSLPVSLDLNTNIKPNDCQVRYFQRKAWIIVSQRNKNKKQEGLSCIRSLEELLFSHSEDNEPLWLWHYYNIKANYAEWEQDYEKAISFYKKCLSIPALGAFEYGATFINMSIAYRFMYLTNGMNSNSIIEKSIKLGSIGVNLKSSVGDRDEMPVVLHNQALNILTKKQINNNELIKVENMTAQGIKILDETSSIKRLGMLLIENIISKILLNKNVDNDINRIENHWKLIDNNEYEQIINLYKMISKKYKIEFLDNIIKGKI
ncbi:lipopolysaccharide assembly protein LapB [Arcobacter sp. CECT 8985]|uniref:tetratricopeptide repeat protein n=1 Tax=Arcobacter sp. CECT 8985 TaxID=1935424 RepID=UPI00100BD07D|nr:hypothetical protein [Arcobacter sp. CECT 8985]RXJ86741.1 hypothetical protein CRU93_07290 [Arcobacter sp. CECT 8985]